jgi:hypothetical protein
MNNKILTEKQVKITGHTGQTSVRYLNLKTPKQGMEQTIQKGALVGICGSKGTVRFMTSQIAKKIALTRPLIFLDSSGEIEKELLCSKLPIDVTFSNPVNAEELLDEVYSLRQELRRHSARHVVIAPFSHLINELPSESRFYVANKIVQELSSIAEEGTTLFMGFEGSDFVSRKLSSRGLLMEV